MHLKQFLKKILTSISEGYLLCLFLLLCIPRILKETLQSSKVVIKGTKTSVFEHHVAAMKRLGKKVI